MTHPTSAPTEAFGPSRPYLAASLRKDLVALFGPLALLALMACGSGGGGGDTQTQPPASLSYVSNPAVYTKGVAIPADNPSHSGGAVASYTVRPALPAGLTLNATTGVISGTPTAITAAAVYMVTASNSAGSASAPLSVTINDAAPTGLTYTYASKTFELGLPAQADTPTSGGGAVVSYAVSPALPAGLLLDAATGVLSGTPSAVKAATTYTVTATNSGGSTAASLVLGVQQTAPSALAYTYTSAVFKVGAAIAMDQPSNSGGLATSYSVAPALPLGLSLDPLTGVLAGTPGTVAASAIYTITASNAAGSSSTQVTIAVTEAPPTSLVYTYTTKVLELSRAFPQDFALANGANLTFSVSPALPAGLLLDSASGTIYGFPTAVTPTTTYTVTAANSGGSVSTNLVFTVVQSAPSGLTYPGFPGLLTVGYSTLTPADYSGGVATSFTISPALPAGLSLDPTIGLIAGTPTAAAAEAIYVVTAQNAAGSTTASLDFKVVAPAPAITTQPVNAIVQPGQPGTFTVAATGLGALSYQWQLNGVDIGGATGTSYTTSPSLLSQNGDLYQVIVSDAYGHHIPSAAAFLVVTTDSFTVTGNMVDGRYYHTATRLLDGRVLVAGGIPGSSAFAGAELYDPTARSFSPTGGLIYARTYHTATLLKDGKVLVTGGLGSTAEIAQCELFDPGTGVWTETGSLLQPLSYHVATTLSDGKVLVVGAGQPGIPATAELYDPSTGTFSYTGAMKGACEAVQGLTLQDGRALIIGSSSGGDISEAEIYDEATGTFSTVGSPLTPRIGFAMALLPSGKVLIAGGDAGTVFTSCELFDPGTGAFTATGSLHAGRTGATTTTLISGKVLIAGGGDANGLIAGTELYDPATGLWSFSASMVHSRKLHTATLLVSGSVLYAGGLDSFLNISGNAETYN